MREGKLYAGFDFRILPLSIVSSFLKDQIGKG